VATLKVILEEIKQDLIQKNQIREDTHEVMRKVTSLSKRAILLIHQKKQIETEKRLKRQQKKLSIFKALLNNILTLFTVACLVRHYRNTLKQTFFLH
jgi:predicted translin family RNA/ssDNA-binding protein